MANHRKLVERNFAEVTDRIAAACARAGRSPDSVLLVAVTKTVGTDIARVLYDLGVRDIGENRVQEAMRKFEQLHDLDFRWHMIGHLQTNKVKRAVQIFSMVHSVDRLHLAQELDKRCGRLNMKMPVLIQVNVSGEESKFGAAPEEAPKLIEEMSRLEHISIEGLMTMAPFYEDSEKCRPVFRALRELRDKIAEMKIENVRMEHLSMGMTNDYEIAVEEGATMVRIGSALFRGIVPPTKH